MYINNCEVCGKEFTSLTERRTCGSNCLARLKRKSLKKTYAQKRSCEQICVGCQRATGKCINSIICPWARDLSPVPGWKAEKIIIKNGEGYQPYESFDIISCPLFIADKKIEVRESFWQWKDLIDRLSRYREVENGYQK